jgi:hypothetical protein
LKNEENLFLELADGKDDDDSLQVIEELEKIDDDCDKHGIQFVKIDDRAAAKEHGVKDVRNHSKGFENSSNFHFSFVSCQQSFSSKSKNRIVTRAT